MSVVYADSSALARLYLTDEPGATELRSLLLGEEARVATSELTDVELAGAVSAAARSGRIADAAGLHRILRDHLRSAVALVPLRPAVVLPEARRLVLGFRLRTLDAIHVAVALDLRRAVDDEVVFVTRDTDQAEAATALGFPVA